MDAASSTPSSSASAPDWWVAPTQRLQPFRIGASRRMSQNFLQSWQIAAEIVAKARSLEAEWLFEVGPGPGTLTQGLVHDGRPVLAVEQDRRLEALLTELGTAHESLTIGWGDGADFDHWLPQRHGRPLLVSNLPYALTGQFLRQIIDYRDQLTGAVLMIQQEVADRLLAKQGSDYGAPSVMIQCYWNIQRLRRVPPGAFIPAPRVWSSVVAITPRQALTERDGFVPFVKAAFAQRRKQLGPRLAAAYPTLDAALNKLGLSPQLRPEALSPAQYAALYEAL